MRCVICDQPANRRVNISYSRIGPDGQQQVSGKLYVCGQDYNLILDMSFDELQFVMRSNVQPVPPPPLSPPVTDRDGTSREALAPFEPHEPQSNGNGLA